MFYLVCKTCLLVKCIAKLETMFLIAVSFSYVQEAAKKKKVEAVGETLEGSKVEKAKSGAMEMQLNGSKTSTYSS